MGEHGASPPIIPRMKDTVSPAWIAAAALGLWLALSAVAAAQDQQLGARTKAMGGSYTAFEDDPVSIWLNPAGIASQPDQGALVYQTYTAYTRGKTRGPGDTVVPTVEPEAIQADPAYWPSYVGVVFQVGKAESPMALGLCIARPYHLVYSMDQVTDPLQTTFVPEAQLEQSFWRIRGAVAKDFRLRPVGEPGFLTHIAVGAGLDNSFETLEFEELNGNDTSDTTSSWGFGLGVLVGLYDDLDALKINLGFAYQSAVKFPFEIETDIVPAFDMPQQVNAGLTLYLLKGTPLRVTFDFQWIDWSETAEDPLHPDFKGFDDAVNVSLGIEYRIPITETVSLYPRAGLRHFDAPWSDKDDLPMTAAYRLVLDTEGEAFSIFTFGLGIGWLSDNQKSRSLDFAADVGGDAVNMAMGLTYEF
jgi:long-subunit fatty acid transport protein